MLNKSLKIKQRAKINNMKKSQNGFVLGQEIRTTKLQSSDNTHDNKSFQIKWENIKQKKSDTDRVVGGDGRSDSRGRPHPGAHQYGQTLPVHPPPLYNWFVTSEYIRDGAMSGERESSLRGSGTDKHRNRIPRLFGVASNLEVGTNITHFVFLSLWTGHVS